jgi:hypothetical protein
VKKTKTELQTIPGIGLRMERDLLLLGIKKISDLKNKDPEKLYRKLETLTRSHQDRCVLYVLRCAIYYAKGGRDAEKLLWWNWKDARNYRPQGR